MPGAPNQQEAEGASASTARSLAGPLAGPTPSFPNQISPCSSRTWVCLRLVPVSAWAWAYVAQSPRFLPTFRPKSRLSPETQVQVGPSSHGLGGKVGDTDTLLWLQLHGKGGHRYGTRYLVPGGQERTKEIRSDFTLVWRSRLERPFWPLRPLWGLKPLCFCSIHFFLKGNALCVFRV